MKALLLPLLLLGQFAGVSTHWNESQALTRAAPTLATQGFPLQDTRGIRVTVCAGSGQTLSGAGTLKAYYFQPDVGLWARNSALDLPVPSDASGLRCWTFPDIDVLIRRGRGLWATSSVTVSGGTTVTLYFDLSSTRGAF